MSPVSPGERGGSPKGKRFISAGLGRQGEYPAAVAAPNRREVPEDEILAPWGSWWVQWLPSHLEVFVLPTPHRAVLPGPGLPACWRNSAPWIPPPATRRSSCRRCCPPWTPGAPGWRCGSWPPGGATCWPPGANPGCFLHPPGHGAARSCRRGWKGDTLFGRGACDAKGQMVAQWLASTGCWARAAPASPGWGWPGRRPTASGAQDAAPGPDRFSGCRALINGEPTELKLAAGQRGRGEPAAGLPGPGRPRRQPGTGPQRHPGPAGLAGGHAPPAPGPATRNWAPRCGTWAPSRAARR